MSVLAFILKVAIKTVSLALALLPLPLALALGRGFGWFLGRVLRYRRREVLEALERSLALPAEECVRIYHEMWRHLGMNVVETMLVAAGKERELFERITVIGEEHAKAALARGKGGFVLTGHCGNWELLGMWTATAKYPPLTILVKRIRNRAINDLIMETRGRLVNDVNIVQQSVRSIRACLRALEQGEIVSFLLDQNTTYNEGVFVNFFGKLCCTSDGLAKMAARTQAPIVPVFMRRTADYRHEITIHPPIDPPAMRDKRTLHEATQQYTKVIEEQIRRHPAQWIWIHRRWRTQIEDIPPHRRDAYIFPEGVFPEGVFPDSVPEGALAGEAGDREAVGEALGEAVGAHAERLASEPGVQ